VRLTTPHIKRIIVKKIEKRGKVDRLNDDGLNRTECMEMTEAAWHVQTVLKPEE